jgi:hypothetical protein
LRTDEYIKNPLYEERARKNYGIGANAEVESSTPSMGINN